jgi:energy-coupling factor transporter transmembrane protein EcfT
MSSDGHTTDITRRDGTALISRDARFLVAGFAMIVASVFVLPNAWGLVVVFFYLLVLHRLAGLPLSSLGRAARIIGPFVVLVVAINAVLVEGEPLVPAIRFISRRGVESGLHGGARVLVLYFATAVFLAVASPEDIAGGISAFVRPISPRIALRAAMHAFLSFGFLPLFIDEIQRIAVAQKFRGGGLDGGLLAKLRGARLLIVPVVLSAVHRSDQLAATIELRRVETRIAGILVLGKASRRDYAFLAVTAAVLAAAWIAF